MCHNCKKVKCTGCTKPQKHAHIESVELIVDDVRGTLTASVNGVESNSILYYQGGGGGGQVDVGTRTLEVLSDGQTLFINALPENSTILSLSVNGVKYIFIEDYIVTGSTDRDVLWQSDKFPLEVEDILVIEYTTNAVTT